VEECNGDNTFDTPKSAMPTVRREKRPRRKKWEKNLPKAFVLAATPSSKSFKIPVEIQSTDTQEIKAAKALLDCGASGVFADQKYVDRERLNTRKLTIPIPVNNVDGTPNESGPISEVLDTILCYKGHSERVVFAVTSLGDQDLILGLPWLRKHNPEVNWRTEEVKMSRCPAQCQTCRDEVKEEKRKMLRVRRCKEGPMPETDLEMEDVPDLGPDSDGDDEEEEEEGLEDGDRIFAAGLGAKTEEIRATGNISQRLAEAFHRNSAPKDFRDAVPNYLHDFEDVFSKESFDALPEQKPWDHAIELVPNAEMGNCKIYPLSWDEQAELDTFVEENLVSRRICQSKSPMAAPCFFIKKKDGKL